LKLLFGVLGALILSGCAPKTTPAPVSKLSISSQPQQTLKGWGIYPCTIQNDRPNARNFTLWERPNAQRLILRELGISFMRCEILAGSYDAEKDDGSLDTAYLDASLVRQMQIARKFGISQSVLTVWSPPAIFKTVATTFGTDPKTKRAARLRRDREADYCRYVVRVFDYLTKIKKLPVPLAYSIQNEPSYAAGQWNGTPYDAEQWARVFVLMRRAFDQNGYRKVKLIGPECGSYAESVAFLGGSDAPKLRDSRFRAAMSGFAFHGYSRLSRRAPYPQELQKVAKIAASHGQDVWMSEYSIIAQKRTPMQHALEASQRLAREMAYIPCNYWTWWQGWYPVSPKSEVLISGVDDNRLNVSKTYFVLQKLWQSAPAGSVVHRVRSSDSQIRGYDPLEVQSVAFDFKGRSTLLVINPTNFPKSLQISGLKGKVAMPFLTDATSDMKKQKTMVIRAGSVRLQMAKQAILILVSGEPAKFR